MLLTRVLGLIELFERDCVSCSGQSPPCPACASNEQCVLISQTCQQCAQAICQANPNSTPTSTVNSASNSTGPNAGAIAGGVVGGLVGVGLVIAYLLWRYVYSPKAREARKQMEFEIEQEEAYEKRASQMTNRVSGMHQDSRLSSATLSSVNTSLTRASNIIPIAYVPGVTNREAPPMPKFLQQSGQTFSADDILRNSQYSEGGIRNSIATTNYRGSTAIISDDMMTAIQGRPNIVEIGNGTKSGDDSRPVSTASTVHYVSAQTINTQRMNAHSIRIGRGMKVGLQDQILEEEEDSDSSDDHEDVLNMVAEDEEDYRGHEVHDRVPYSLPKAQEFDKDKLRYSRSSGFEVQFGMGSADDQDKKTYTGESSSRSGTENSAKTERSKSQKSQGRLTIASTMSRDSRVTVSRKSSNNRASAEYVMDDLPIEAYLYAKQQGGDDNDKNGRKSPFDDKYGI